MAKRKKPNTGVPAQERAVIDATLGRPTSMKNAQVAADVQAIIEKGGIVDIPPEIAAPEPPRAHKKGKR